MRKSALVIGRFTATETGFTGKLDTLAVTAIVTFGRNKEKEQKNHPDFTVLSGGKEIGVAWEYEDERGPYISVGFEESSLAPGSHKLVKSGVEKGYALTYRQPMPKKDKK